MGTRVGKIIVLATVSVLVVGAVSSYAFFSSQAADNQLRQAVIQPQGQANNAYSSIASSEVRRSLVEADILWNTQDSYYGYNKDPVVARVHIDSIDGGRTYSPISDQYVFPQTIGKMTVREVYKGNVKSGEQLSYFRPGGIVTYDEYWKSLNKQQQDKILSLNNGKQPAHETYIQNKFADDIDIEVSKDYVVFLVPQSSRDGKRQEYLVDGFQYGLREVRGSDADATVLNNDTKKWESLDTIVKRN